MNPDALANLNVESHKLLASPREIRLRYPLSEEGAEVVHQGRQAIYNILDGKDSRLFLVLGPCSIHDTKAALEYAEKLKVLADKVQDHFLLVMRVYFEKPRTTVGWKGLINDPDLDDSFQIEKGLRTARQLLVQLAEMGLPTATEALDPIVPQYISDLISWTAIGARTTESQTHREMASGLSTPIGFKNGTDGNIQVAINAIESAHNPHSFLGIDLDGRISVYKTKGNDYSHVVLRGGPKTNYHAEDIQACVQELKKHQLREKIMIDCSHGNSSKQHRRQIDVFQDVIHQVAGGNSAIIGMMIESHLQEGNQSIPKDLSQLKYGVSVTDACLDWGSTEKMILEAVEKLDAVKKS